MSYTSKSEESERRILIVDSEPLFAKGLKFYLEQDGYIAVTVYNAVEALDAMDKNKYGLVILDIIAAEASGILLYNNIRQKYGVPILLLVENGMDMENINGEYEYIRKPLNAQNMKNIIRSLLHKTVEKDNNVEIIKSRELTVDTLLRKVNFGSREIELTSKEFSILSLLVKNKNKVYSREALLQMVWGYGFSGDSRTVDVHVRRIREKIELVPSQPSYIMTKWGLGYYFSG